MDCPLYTGREETPAQREEGGAPGICWPNNGGLERGGGKENNNLSKLEFSLLQTSQ